MHQIHTLIASLALISLAAATPSHAQPARGTPPAPPPGAYAACKGKTEGASVTLTMPEGTPWPALAAQWTAPWWPCPLAGPVAPARVARPPPADPPCRPCAPSSPCPT